MRSLVTPLVTPLVTLLVALVMAAACSSSSPEAGDPAPSSTPIESATPTAAPAETDAPVAEATSAPTASPTAAPVDAEARGERRRQRCIQRLPLRFALGQLMVPLAAPAELEAVAAAGATGSLGGVVLLGAPTQPQLVALGRAEEAGFELLVMSDEEGGTVQRLGHLLGPLASARAQTLLAPESVTALVQSYAEGMASLGVDVALAPTVDVGAGPGIGDRSFSEDAAVVSEYGAAVITGFRRGGVIPALKHFPGHGRASADSHLGFATTPSIDELRLSDLIPYKRLLRRVDMVLVGHLLVPGLTENLPTSLSPAAIDGLLRTELGFEGVVITDGLGMQAIAQRWNSRQAALLAILAGADLVILDDPGRAEGVVLFLQHAVETGDLSRERINMSIDRTFALRGLDPCAIVETVQSIAIPAGG